MVKNVPVVILMAVMDQESVMPNAQTIRTNCVEEWKATQFLKQTSLVSSDNE